MTKIAWIPARATGHWEMVKVDERSGIGTKTGFTVSLAETVNWPYGYGSRDEQVSSRSPSSGDRVPRRIGSNKPSGEILDQMLRLRAEAARPQSQHPEVSERILASFQAEAEARQREVTLAMIETGASNFLHERARYRDATWAVVAAIRLVSRLSLQELNEIRKEQDPAVRPPRFRSTKAARAHFVRELEMTQSQLSEASRRFDVDGDLRPPSARMILSDPHLPAFASLRDFVSARPNYFDRIEDGELHRDLVLLRQAEQV